MSVGRVFSLVAIFVVAAMSSFAIATSSQGNPESGRKIYLESCQSCYGLTGKGDSDMAAYLTPSPSDLSAKPTQAKTDVELRTIILEGRPGTAMASFDGAV